MTDQEKPAETPAPEIEAELPLPEAAAKSEKGPEIKPAEQSKLASNLSRWQRLRGWYLSRKKWSIPLSVLVMLLLVLAIPTTRYPLAGLVLRKNFTIQVNDQTTNTPVSGATVSSGSVSALTDGNGKAKIRLSVGHHTVMISKKYYQDRRADVLVPILGQKTPPVIAAQATGRQVKITVKNLVSGESLADVDIKVLDITAKTDKDGKALIVLPAGEATQKAALSLSGYNDADVSVKVSDAEVEENNFTITPVGKIYFLSKLSGKIDVVKTDLDGANRQTILAGTGKEDNYGTILLPNRDWKHLALLSTRDSELPKLYLIDAATDKLTAMDEGNAYFNPVGWSDDNFVYVVNRNNTLLWEPKAQALKSFNATTKQITTLDQTKAEGNGRDDYFKESLGRVYLVGKNVIYEKTWSTQDSYNPGINDKLAGIYSIGPNGGNPQTLRNFNYAYGQITYINSMTYKSNQIYYRVIEKDPPEDYYVYAAGKLTAKPDIADTFNHYQPISYLISPAANSTFWFEARDGKNTLFVGDQNGENGKQIVSQSDYSAYGWFSDDYLLVSKSSSELYIMSKSGIKKDSEAIKISDYHRAGQNFSGYGGL